ncbi:hypothetical protein AXF42_Ash019242 [Apostasia shenzhenica]|uniref:Retrovirus-related Pol polyprotein from transposon TNT 1-94-like beta-barrel domain-containing protein n=1 Tax=Apostasia shenzhenica TaxID=1088818 RepID=A0A2I0A310_9ASPA|nr:hypothetical protein AXF42_Ash019242 [Apostasia shenzhenica]
MTGDRSKFTNLEMKDGRFMTFGENTKKRILGIGVIGNSTKFSINKVFLVDGLAFNLLSISQLCDNGFNINFVSSRCDILLNNKILFSGHRIDNMYKIDLSTIENPNLNCLSTQTQESWLWHR